MRLEPNPNTHPRLLRKAALPEELAIEHKAKAGQKRGSAKAPASLKSPGTASAAPGQGSRDSRFIDPVHLDEHQKSEICKALKRKQVGDEMGRQIFVAAVEYQLSAFSDQLVRGDIPAPAHAPAPRDRALEQILLAVEEQARMLSDLLLQIPQPSRPALVRVLTAQDERGRAYDEHYLSELVCEIDRLRNACGTMTAVTETPQPGPDPESSRGFVHQLAGVFSECFEQTPTAAEDGPFRACLMVLEEYTGLLIGHEPGFIARAIDQD
jgi:hypothetical protein